MPKRKALHEEDWTAYYSPSCDNDPSQSGFPSRRAARKWVRKTIVNGRCRKGRARYWARHKSVIWCEWVFVKTEGLVECDNIGDVFDAAGAKRIW